MNRAMRRIPGRMPAANRRAIDTSAETPYTMNVIDGGIMIPRVPAQVRAPMLIRES
jgi:hypothetical protein